MEQRSDDWLNIRKGVLTASQVGPWLLADTKVAKQARESAICRMIAQKVGAWEQPIFETEAMRRGTELEPAAVDAFSKATGLTVRPVGFCLSIHGAFGCSPDGLIDSEGAGFEGKCPVPATHIAYRRAGVLPDAYLYQIHFSMAVTGASKWYFQSFSPALANFRIEVKRDEMTENLLAAAIAFSRDLERAFTAEEVAYLAEFGKGAA